MRCRPQQLATAFSKLATSYKAHKSAREAHAQKKRKSAKQIDEDTAIGEEMVLQRLLARRIHHDAVLRKDFIDAVSEEDDVKVLLDGIEGPLTAVEAQAIQDAVDDDYGEDTVRVLTVLSIVDPRPPTPPAGGLSKEEVRALLQEEMKRKDSGLRQSVDAQIQAARGTDAPAPVVVQLAATWAPPANAKRVHQLPGRNPAPGVPGFIVHNKFCVGGNTNVGNALIKTNTQIVYNFAVPIYVITAYYDPGNFTDFCEFLSDPFSSPLLESNPPMKWKLLSTQLTGHATVRGTLESIRQKSRSTGSPELNASERLLLQSLIAMYFIMLYDGCGFTYSQLRVISSLTVDDWANMSLVALQKRIEEDEACPLHASCRAYVNRACANDLECPALMAQHYGDEYPGRTQYTENVRELERAHLERRVIDLIPHGAVSAASNAGPKDTRGDKAVTRGSTKASSGFEAKPDRNDPVEILPVWSSKVQALMREAIKTRPTHGAIRDEAYGSQVCFRCLKKHATLQAKACSEPEHEIVTGFSRKHPQYAAALVAMGLVKV